MVVVRGEEADVLAALCPLTATIWGFSHAFPRQRGSQQLHSEPSAVPKLLKPTLTSAADVTIPPQSPIRVISSPTFQRHHEPPHPLTLDKGVHSSSEISSGGH